MCFHGYANWHKKDSVLVSNQLSLRLYHETEYYFTTTQRQLLNTLLLREQKCRLLVTIMKQNIVCQ